MVQRFEYTYELCHKMLRRQLQEISATTSEVVALDYKSLIHEGAGKLIARPDAWFAYRRQRNLTSHTYDESVADCQKCDRILKRCSAVARTAKMSDSIELKTSELELVRKILGDTIPDFRYGPSVQASLATTKGVLTWIS